MSEVGVQNKKLLLITSIFLFLLILPFTLKITFYQNDDWVYYLNVEWLLHGKFELHQYLGPTFIGQGLIAAAFAKLFGLSRLPLLTLLFSTFNFYLVALICLKFLKRTLFESILGGFLFYITPIQIYLVFGFMTGNYFLFFFLISIYTFLLYEETRSNEYLYLTYMVSFLGLFIRQVSLVIPLSIGIYQLLKKQYKNGLQSLLVFGLYYGFLNYIFPLTAAMKRATLQFHHFSEPSYIYALSYGALIIVVAYLLPVFVAVIKLKDLVNKKGKFLLFIIFSLVIYFVGGHFFKPEQVSWGEFPYFENTVERTGFYPRGIHGTKYQFQGNFDLYRFWDLTAKILLSMVTAYLIVSKKLKINIFLILIISYIGVLNLTETHYDRYLLLLFPLTIFYLYSLEIQFSKMNILYFVFFITFMIFLMYQFSMDFIEVNRYVWHKSQDLAATENIEPKLIHGTNAWKLNYKNEDRAYIYFFSYDSQSVNPSLNENYTLIETKEIEFPYSIFIEPKIYLYKIK